MTSHFPSKPLSKGLCYAIFRGRYISIGLGLSAAVKLPCQPFPTAAQVFGRGFAGDGFEDTLEAVGREDGKFPHVRQLQGLGVVALKAADHRVQALMIVYSVFYHLKALIAGNFCMISAYEWKNLPFWRCRSKLRCWSSKV